MPKLKTSRKQENRSARHEPFADVAERLGAALADTIAHPDCPATVADAISELETSVFNRFPDVAISLRYSFPHRLVGAFEQIA